PPPAGTYAFYRAIDLAGAALTLDGNAWQGSTAPNYSTNGTAFANNTIALLPATDAPRTGMIRSSVYAFGSLNVTLSAVPAGQYRVWAYVWEDNNAETFALALNGQAVLSTYNSGPAGTWKKLGPFETSLAAPGQLQLTTSGGAANISGIEVWKATGGAMAPNTTLPDAEATATSAMTRIFAPNSAIYPNPSPTGRYTVEFPAELGTALTYTLVSPLGRTVAQGNLRVAPGSTYTELNLSDPVLAPGLYYLRLSGVRRHVQYKLFR
ncbi:T9SS type A sorting domain-containing protein, partial [Hymenobacter elongatus]|uniref:T9SS type A sorting domain-containing protein n=1 Tax=Hymenobacter elongatus TaxID=877208 RepID=UPI00143695A3